MLYTDNRCLFDVISKGLKTAERRLMLDIAVSRQAFRSREISDIGFLRSHHNLADGFTKPMQQAALRTVLRTSYWRPQAEQWILRAPPSRLPSASRENFDRGECQSLDHKSERDGLETRKTRVSFAPMPAEAAVDTATRALK